MGSLDDPHVHRLVPRDDRRVERLGHVAGDLLRPIERGVVRGLQEVHLLLDSLLIVRQLVGQRGELPHDDVADPAQGPEREGDREEDRDRPRHPTPLEEPRKRRQCEAEEHRQGQGLQHLGRERHRGDDRQDEEGHDGRMVHRGLALRGHGGVPVRVIRISQPTRDKLTLKINDKPQQDQRDRIASPVISPATRPTPKAATTVSVGWWRTRPSASVVTLTDLVAHLVGVPAGGPGRMLHGRRAPRGHFREGTSRWRHASRRSSAGSGRSAASRFPSCTRRSSSVKLIPAFPCQGAEVVPLPLIVCTLIAMSSSSLFGIGRYDAGFSWWISIHTR